MNPLCHHCDPKRTAEQGHLVRTQTGGCVCIRTVCTAGVQVRAACKMAEPAKILDQPSNHKSLTEKQMSECYIRERVTESIDDLKVTKYIYYAFLYYYMVCVLSCHSET